MSLALYMDVHVPVAITHGLCRRGVDVVTAQADNARRLPDDALLARATALGRVLFTRDEDLLAEATRCQRGGRFFSGVVYAHQLRLTIGQCVKDLELIAKLYEPADMAIGRLGQWHFTARELVRAGLHIDPRLAH